MMHPSYLTLDRYHLDPEHQTETSEHVAECDDCQRYLARLQHVQTSTLPTWLKELAAETTPPRTIASVRWHGWSLGPALAAAAALGAFMWVGRDNREEASVSQPTVAPRMTIPRPTPTSESPLPPADEPGHESPPVTPERVRPTPSTSAMEASEAPPDEGYVGTKGDANVALYLKRADRVFLWREEPVHPGDRVRLQVSAEKFQRVEVLTRSTSGLQTLYEGAISGTESLPVAWEIDASNSDEHLIVVLSDKPLPRARLSGLLNDPEDRSPDIWVREFVLRKGDLP